MSDNSEKTKQETTTNEEDHSTSNKPPSYGTRLVQNKEDIKFIVVPQGTTKE
jgi:hypothetical protein